MDNTDLIQHLQAIGIYYQNLNDFFRSRTFMDAALNIQRFPEAIVSGSQARSQIRGIGESVEQVIDQFLETGTSARYRLLSQKDPEREAVLKVLMRVYGIGPVTANQLYDEGVRTIEDLSARRLTSAQRLGVDYYYDLQKRIPRSEIDDIHRVLEMAFEGLEWVIVGSYRRGMADSGDIDVLIKRRPGDPVTIQNLVQRLQSVELDDGTSFLRGILAQGAKKFMGIVQMYPPIVYNGEIEDAGTPARRLDLLIVDSESWGTALVYFTGSQRFNIYLRQKANELGLTLNEYRFQNLGDSSISYFASTEQEVFNFLKLDYVPPQQRNM